MEPSHPFDITWQSLWRIAVAVALAFVVYKGIDVILGFCLAIVIAAALDAPITWLQKKRIPRVVGALGIFATLVVLAAALIYAVVPIAISEFTNLIANATHIKGQADSSLGFIKISQVTNVIVERFNTLANSLITGNVSLLAVASFLFGGIFLAVAVFVLSFYLTVGQDGVEKFILATVPPAYEDYALDLYFRVRHKIGKWLKAQVILSVIVAIFVFIGLWLLNVDYALLLALLAGMFEIIPFVGPVFSGGVAILISLSTSLTVALYTLALFVIVQQVESHVIVPSVMRLTANLNPALVIIALTLGGGVFGFAGLVLAVPAAVLLQEVAADWASSKHKRRGLGL
ncbi:MAG: AI-2E family transporter [Candidatus Pacebacteria bacterium]|nr:AI-2E family transporter [Candidatus Paceibacterota bacterium]